MQINIDSSWKNELSDEFEKPYFKDLLKNIELEYSLGTCFPPKELIFSAFNHCSFDEVKVVIIGQDPYHGKGEANGLCFSVNDSIKIPASLRNIFTEINDDLNSIFIPTSGNLERWASQGILLLNATLTVKENKAGSHQKLGWEKFTDAVVEKISDKKENIIFFFFGNFAIKKGKNIARTKHFVLESGHPSFAHSHKKWFKNKHFSETNKRLIQQGKTPIIW